MAAALASLTIAAGSAAAGTTVLASVSSSGEMANGESANVVGFDPSLGVTYSADTIAISADGRYARARRTSPRAIRTASSTSSSATSRRERPSA